MLQIPETITQGDSATWLDGPFQDSQGNPLTSASYSFAYQIVGPEASPLVLTGAPNLTGWSTSISTAQSAALEVGLHAWQGIVTAAGVKVTVGSGQLQVVQDFSQIRAPYDPRTPAQIALAICEQAMASFRTNGELVKSYSIGGRSMVFKDERDLIARTEYWRGRVAMEKAGADGGKSRRILTRFDSAH